VKPFVEEGYFAGGLTVFLNEISVSYKQFPNFDPYFEELYVDTDKACYNALQYQVFSYWDLTKKLLTGKWREAIAKVCIY
jgi:hypothetical protein